MVFLQRLVVHFCCFYCPLILKDKKAVVVVLTLQEMWVEYTVLLALAKLTGEKVK